MASKPSQATNESFNPSKKPKPQPQLTKSWAVPEEVLDSLKLLLIATYPTIVGLGYVLEPCQQPYLAVPRYKTYN